MGKITRAANVSDAEMIANIFNEGIEDRIATFETELRSADDVRQWFASDRPIIVVENDGDVAAFASLYPYADRACYAGIGEFSVYVSRKHRGAGLGTLALNGLINAASQRNYWKILSRIFPENKASLALCESVGFRVVGTYKKHGQLDGVWRDCVIVEFLIENSRT